jgi:hypothetical protein
MKAPAGVIEIRYGKATIVLPEDGTITVAPFVAEQLKKIGFEGDVPESDFTWFSPTALAFLTGALGRKFDQPVSESEAREILSGHSAPLAWVSVKS